MGETALTHGGHDIVGVVLQGVIRGCCCCCSAAVVVNPKTTTDIEEPHRCSKSRQFDVDLASFLEGILEDGNVIDLTADMKVQQA